MNRGNVPIEVACNGSLHRYTSQRTNHGIIVLHPRRASILGAPSIFLYRKKTGVTIVFFLVIRVLNLNTIWMRPARFCSSYFAPAKRRSPGTFR